MIMKTSILKYTIALAGMLTVTSNCREFLGSEELIPVVTR